MKQLLTPSKTRWQLKSLTPQKWVAVNKYIYKLIKQIIRVNVLYESTCVCVI